MSNTVPVCDWVVVVVEVVFCVYVLVTLPTLSVAVLFKVLLLTGSVVVVPIVVQLPH
jgi:hypothetical protein